MDTPDDLLACRWHIHGTGRRKAPTDDDKRRKPIAQVTRRITTYAPVTGTRVVVRLHLLTSEPRTRSWRGQSQGSSGSRRHGSVTLASVISPERRAAIAGPAQAT